MQSFGKDIEVLGTPHQSHGIKVMLLGSGELGKELTIELQRLGVQVVACDSYAHAPAMQVAQSHRVFDMKDPGALRAAVRAESPHLIVPEVEAIATAELVQLEQEGFRVIPTARATRLTMDREGIRQMAAQECGLPTASYRYADSWDSFQKACSEFNYRCVVKPLMSSSGKGQSVVHSPSEMTHAWEVAQTGGRTGPGRVIVEEFVDFESEITLLTVVSSQGVFFCDPIGHLQKGGDYVESWQPHFLTEEQWIEAKRMAQIITQNLGGYGVFGVELFLLKNGKVLFSEVSPRPHDTGMVTMVTQSQSQFALHARAILGLPVGQDWRYTDGASVALKATQVISEPGYVGVKQALNTPGVQIRLFGKPKTTLGRRMGVVLAAASDVAKARERAKSASQAIEMVEMAGRP
jgi:phosphoribosylglycinamide formyltransferase 2